jgi:hypothetical protein
VLVWQCRWLRKKKIQKVRCTIELSLHAVTLETVSFAVEHSEILEHQSERFKCPRRLCDTSDFYYTSGTRLCCRCQQRAH